MLPSTAPARESDRDSYYVLVAACVFARKSEWLRNACLAAALLFPAVAAVHAIVLAALHVDGELFVPAVPLPAQ